MRLPGSLSLKETGCGGCTSRDETVKLARQILGWHEADEELRWVNEIVDLPDHGWNDPRGELIDDPDGNHRQDRNDRHAQSALPEQANDRFSVQRHGSPSRGAQLKIGTEANTRKTALTDGNSTCQRLEVEWPNKD